MHPQHGIPHTTRNISIDRSHSTKACKICFRKLHLWSRGTPILRYLQYTQVAIHVAQKSHIWIVFYKIKNNLINITFLPSVHPPLHHVNRSLYIQTLQFWSPQISLLCKNYKNVEPTTLSLRHSISIRYLPTPGLYMDETHEVHKNKQQGP